MVHSVEYYGVYQVYVCIVIQKPTASPNACVTYEVHCELTVKEERVFAITVNSRYNRMTFANICKITLCILYQSHWLKVTSALPGSRCTMHSI